MSLRLSATSRKSPLFEAFIQDGGFASMYLGLIMQNKGKGLTEKLMGWRVLDYRIEVKGLAQGLRI